MTQENFWIEQNLHTTSQKKFSPSGRYYLIVQSYKTKDGCWNYTWGHVFRNCDHKEIGDIKRNYSTFHHSWVTKNGEEYLISGTSYMKQTIINLDQAKTYQYDGDSKFCWASCRLSPDGNILAVDGCYWACPYETKFFDFTNPEQGWPELEIIADGKESVIYEEEDGNPVNFNEDSSVSITKSNKVFTSLNKTQYEITEEEKQMLGSEYEKDTNWQIVIDIKYNLKRENNKMLVKDLWISEGEKARIKRREEADAKWDAWLKNFRERDPLYLEFSKLGKTLKSASNYETHGITYKKWSPTFTKEETRWGKRIVDSKYDRDTRITTGYTVDLDWAVETGPIKLTIFKDGKSLEEKFYEHSIEDMQKAFAYAKELESYNENI